MQKLKSAMSRNGGEQQNVSSRQEASTCMKISARGLGTVGGFVAVGTGIWVATAILVGNLLSFGVGVWQALAGLICLIVEAPSCFPKFRAIVEKQPTWTKSLLFVGLGAPPVFLLYTSLWVWLGSGAVFATGVLYGFITMGKRASLEDMARAVQSRTSTSSSGIQSSLVDNAQPMGASLHV